MIAYVDSSAAVKLLKRETHSAAVAAYLNGLVASRDHLISSTLLETEVRRAATRQGVSQVTATEVLSRVDIYDLARSVFTSAGALPGTDVRSLDAIHIAAALRLDADTIVTYDKRQGELAAQVGLRIVSPG